MNRSGAPLPWSALALRLAAHGQQGRAMTAHCRTFRSKTFRAWTLLGAMGLAFALVSASTAEAAKHGKHVKRVVAASAAVPADKSRDWGRNLVPFGPLYNGPDYLGDDPDPNIRSQIIRDLTGRYGGID
jgi:hypothetical protein